MADKEKKDKKNICLDELKDALPAAEEELQPIFKNFVLEEIADFINEGKAKRVITMSGAGISTAAGIPDFRSPETGLYHNLEKYNLPNPMAVFSLDYFTHNPKPFFELAKSLYPGKCKPTLTHYFIRLLHDKGLLLRHFTQNIDNLEVLAGLPEDRIVEAHGSFRTSHCIKCKKVHDLPFVKERVFADEIPTCTEPKCEGIVKPDIVFFGEQLPKRFSDKVGTDFKKCDLLIIIGTSLAVMPFAHLISLVGKDVPRLYINLEYNEEQSITFFQTQSLQYGKPSNHRDVYEKINCDEGCLKLAEMLGWKEDLEALFAAEHKRLDVILAEGKDVEGCVEHSKK